METVKFQPIAWKIVLLLYIKFDKEKKKISEHTAVQFNQYVFMHGLCARKPNSPHT